MNKLNNANDNKHKHKANNSINRNQLNKTIKSKQATKNNYIIKRANAKQNKSNQTNKTSCSKRKHKQLTTNPKPTLPIQPKSQNKQTEITDSPGKPMQHQSIIHPISTITSLNQTKQAINNATTKPQTQANRK